VNTTSELDIFVRNGVWVTPDVDSQTSNRWQKDLDIRARDELWIHAIRHSKDGLMIVEEYDEDG